MSEISMMDRLRVVQRRITELAGISYPTHETQLLLTAEALALRDRLDELSNGAPLTDGNESHHVICLCPDCVKPKADDTAFHLNNDKTVAVGGHEFHDMDTCPRGVKVLLLGPGDVATLASFDGHDPQWRGWFPVPRKRKSK